MTNLWVLVAGTDRDIDASEQIAERWDALRSASEENSKGSVNIRAWTSNLYFRPDSDVLVVLIGLWWQRPLHFEYSSYVRLAEAVSFYRVGRIGLAVFAPDFEVGKPFKVDDAVWTERCQPILAELAAIQSDRYSPSALDLWSSPDLAQIIQVATAPIRKNPQAGSPTSVFLSYSHADEGLREKLHRHLRLLEHTGLLQVWYDRRIVPGDEWAEAIKTHLYVSDLILLLVSADFFASDYCMTVEVPVALDRHNSRSARAVPVLLRPVVWNLSPLAKLQALPKDAKPVTSWHSQDLAFVNICEGIVGWMVTGNNGSSYDRSSRREGPYSVRKRILDSAMPSEVEVGKAAMLVALIRKAGSAGLRALVDGRREYGIEPKEVHSTPPVPVRFPIGPDDQAEPLTLFVTVQSPDFEPPTQRRSLSLDPNSDSQPIIFMVSAKKTGDLKVLVEVRYREEVIAECVVRTLAKQGEIPAPRPSVASAQFQLDDERAGSIRKLELQRAAEDLLETLRQEDFGRADRLMNTILAEYPEDSHVKRLLEEIERRKAAHVGQLIKQTSELVQQNRLEEAYVLAERIISISGRSTEGYDLLRRIGHLRQQRDTELKNQMENLKARLRTERIAKREDNERPAERTDQGDERRPELDRNSEEELHRKRPKSPYKPPARFDETQSLPSPARTPAEGERTHERRSPRQQRRSSALIWALAGIAALVLIWLLFRAAF